MKAARDEGFDDLLVVGTRGVLEPFAAASVLREGERLAGKQLPPFAEELLEPWLNRALRESNAVRMLATHVIAGEVVPFNGLLEALKLRLLDLISPAFGVWSAGPDASSFWRSFPALRWLVARSVRDWAQATTLFLRRLAGDQGLLARSLGVTRLPAVAFVEATAADLHPRGAMVLKVGLTGGACIFYKPRPVTGEWLWSALLDAMAAGLQLPAGRVVFGGQASGHAAYGWMESMHEEEAWPGGRHSGHSATRRSYWESAGALLCLAQHVRLTDLHMGNVLATQNGPAVTDAECLGTVGSSASAVDKFAGAVQGLRATGLLPQNVGPAGVDASGLFGHSRAIPGLWVSRWAVSRTGAWRLTELPAALVAHGNRPQDADVVSPLAVAAQLSSGYRRGAELLMQVRRQLLAAGSQWRQTLETLHAPRCVIRETLFYGKLLSQSLGAQSVTDHGERRRALTSSLSAQGSALPEPVVQAEIRALMAGSVPRLAISPGSRTACDSDGRPLQPNFIDCTPAEAVVRVLESLTTATLQETLLPALLSALL